MYAPPPFYGSHGPPQFQQSQSSRGAKQPNEWGPGTVICNSVKSSFYTPALSTFCTNYASAGSPSFENSFGSVPPPVVCQICHSPGHSVVACPSRFVQAQAPALAISAGKSTPAVWYPNSCASPHMTVGDLHLSTMPIQMFCKINLFILDH
ncbi:unnamed protein product [Cuscuta europaea]|uniref:Uncharacterized protein n=1 Tax=Cuscuta europaea TaxID=41803 RepID=A0A9P1EDE6_CUSEU|nr:unnamed protein product [Cuscuta europaea]